MTFAKLTEKMQGVGPEVGAAVLNLQDLAAIYREMPREEGPAEAGGYMGMKWLYPDRELPMLASPFIAVGEVLFFPDPRTAYEATRNPVAKGK